MSSKEKHLTLELRKMIEEGLVNGSSRANIARTIGKDPSTIAKEVRKHRFVNNRYCKAVNGVKPVFDCIHFEACHKKNVCQSPCKQYKPRPCQRRISLF